MSAMYRCYNCSRICLCKECFSRLHSDKTVHESFQPISDSCILDCKFKLVDKSTLIKDIKFLNNGLLVVATNAQHKKILTCSISGMNKKFIPITGCAERITVMEGNYVAVLLAEYGKVNIGIVDIQKGYVKKYIQDTKCSWNYRSAFIYIENQFFISDFEKINVLDQSGKLKKQIPCSTPVDLCCDFDLLRIYFINELSSKMFFIDVEGNNTPKCTDHNLKDPKSITTYDKEYMLVLCLNENALYNVIKVDYSGQSSETVITNIRIPNCRPNICFTRLTNSLVMGLMGTVYIYKKE
ncbi:PLD1_2 [Mytilus coruscus]|uniref:PLD1_2 n=1 Tax=Mytilus coruscus TaxID=42192 RepID=A0A6J8DUA5_MYTCO|nr:PLD1_2 [Mytilus coruscus]